MEDENKDLKDEVEVQSQQEGKEERINIFRSTKFPQTRVRNMMKMDPDLHLASQESVFLVCKAVV
jgi:DNA polymerase epsilon subunit 4